MVKLYALTLMDPDLKDISKVEKEKAEEGGLIRD